MPYHKSCSNNLLFSSSLGNSITNRNLLESDFSGRIVFLSWTQDQELTLQSYIDNYQIYYIRTYSLKCILVYEKMCYKSFC